MGVTGFVVFSAALAGREGDFAEACVGIVFLYVLVGADFGGVREGEARDKNAVAA